MIKLHAWGINIVIFACTVREINARPLANANAFWAGGVENWPGQVDFCIEHTRDICFRVSVPKILFFPHWYIVYITKKKQGKTKTCAWTCIVNLSSR